MGFIRHESDLAKAYLTWKPDNAQFAEECFILVAVDELEDYENPDHYLITIGESIFHINFGGMLELMEMFKKISIILDNE